MYTAVTGKCVSPKCSGLKFFSWKLEASATLLFRIAGGSWSTLRRKSRTLVKPSRFLIERNSEYHKKVERLYREKGLSLRRRVRKKATAVPRVALPRPSQPGRCYAMDFVHDRFATERRFKCLTMSGDCNGYLHRGL